MFERASYKKAAKAQLKGRWKIPVLTTLLIFALIFAEIRCSLSENSARAVLHIYF